MSKVEIVESRVLHENLGRCERCTVGKRATYRISVDGVEEDVCGYHYGEAKGYVSDTGGGSDNSRADEQ